MDTGIKDELNRYEHVTNRLIEALDRASRKDSNSGNISTVHINAGGIGVLVCACLASFITGIGIMMGVLVVKQGTDIASLHDYLSAIYQMAPQLKPTEDKHK